MGAGAGIVNTDVCAECGADVDRQGDFTRLGELKFRRLLCAPCYRNTRNGGAQDDMFAEMGSYSRRSARVNEPVPSGEVHLPIAENAEPLVIRPNETKALTYDAALMLTERLASLQYQLAKETKRRRAQESLYAEIYAALNNIVAPELVEESRVLAVMRATLCGLLGWPEDDVAQLAESLYYIATAHEPVTLRHMVEQLAGPVPPPPF